MNKILAVLSSLLLFSECFGGEDDFLRPVGKPPKAKAQRRQGGEAFPPLPLPVTPLRRSEKKRPPSPGVLIGKVIWGGYIDYKWPNGVISRVFDWNMVPADCSQLLHLVKRYTKMEYKVQTLDLKIFTGNPAEVPVLFFSGGRSFKLTPAETLKLRRYLQAGGMVWFDSVVGSPYFYKSALQAVRQVLPDCPVKRLAPDNPVFRIVKPLNSAQINDGKYILPALDGVYIGSRLAAVISPYGMGGGWDNTYPELIAKAEYYQRYPATVLGVNLAAYAVGWSQNGRLYAYRETPEPGAEKKDPDKVLFAQLRSSGIWNATPGAESRFMRYLSKNVNINAGSEPVPVSAAKNQLENYPFLYFTGIGHFKFSADELEKLRRYLDNGGFIFINNALGMNEFNQSVIAAVKKLYPKNELENIPKDDPLFAAAPFKFADSGLSQEAAQKFRGQSRPFLFGLKTDKRYKIVYSPVDLAAGWLGAPSPGSVSYNQDTALRLGADIITYFLTH
jgi:hypothetical protein